MLFGHRSLQQQQDEHIEEIHQMAVRMKHTGENINAELKHQDELMLQLDQQIDETTGKLKGLKGELGDLLDTNDINQVCSCMLMCGIMLILIVLVITI